MSPRHVRPSDSDSSTSSSSADGPHTTRRRLPRPYRNIPRTLWVLALMCLLAIGMLEGYSRWTHPDGGRDDTLSGAMFVLGACALSMAIGASAGWFYLRVIYRRLGLFEKGEYLAHWTCSLDEWHSFLNGEPQRRTAQGLNNTLILTVLGALAGAIFLMLILVDPPPRESTFAILRRHRRRSWEVAAKT
jgi:hypothetical protein